MKKRGIYSAIGAGFLLILACAGCSEEKQDMQEKTKAADNRRLKNKVEKAEIQDIDNIHLRDNELLYREEDDTGVVTMYLTVSRGNESENTNHTWKEINTYSAYDYAGMGVERYRAEALLQVGDENGPQKGAVGYGGNAPNATVQIRGQTSSRNQQKSYKIELKKNKGDFNGQRTISLNKHQTDGLRFRNKLAYDLLKEIPQIMGLRTRFVHLYVKDNTGKAEGKFQDYGLYTQVEQPNKTALKAHGMDSNGQLYKINFFEFYRYEDIIKKEDDPEYNLKEFEKLLEVKGDRDHTKLIEMLDAVNDNSIPIDKVLDKYFDRENIRWWMAFQILIGNVDTQNRNVYIYSPQNSATWYFLPWDHDAALNDTECRITDFTAQGSWEAGISNYWGNVLFQRCLKSGTFRKELDDTIKQLKIFLSEERLSEMAAKYREVVKPYVYRMPDRMNALLTETEYEEVAEALPAEIEGNYKRYLENLEKPMPFYIGVPKITGGQLEIHWEHSYDLDAERVTYTVELAKDCHFQRMVYQKENVTVPKITMKVPGAGQYFVRIRATNESGESQDAFDYYVTEKGKNFGMKCFYINRDGTVGEDVYEE